MCDRETYIAPQPDEDAPVRSWVFMETCNGPLDCGYRATYLDEDGDLLTMDDCPSFTSGEVAAAHSRHMAFAAAKAAA